MHHTIKTKTGEINVFIGLSYMASPTVGGVIILANKEIHAVNMLADFIGVRAKEFEKILLATNSWQGAWDYFKGEK